MIKKKSGQLFVPESTGAIDQSQEVGEQGLENNGKILNGPELFI